MLLSDFQGHENKNSTNSTP